MLIDIHALETIRQLVRTAAREELMTRFRVVNVHTKADGSLITEADLSMQRRVQSELAGHWPAIAFLGEEMPAEEQQRLLGESDNGLWCLDPLDGTSNYAAGIPLFAVSLALIHQGRVEVAVVYDPARDECFSALRGRGAWLNGVPLHAAASPPVLADAMAMVDLKRLPAPLVAALARKAPYRSQRSFGSVALDWCWVALGRCQVYLHGGQKLWDYAAGRLVLEEAGAVGGLLDDYRGAWLSELSLTPKIALAATHDDLLQQWRRWVSAAVGG